MYCFLDVDTILSNCFSISFEALTKKSELTPGDNYTLHPCFFYQSHNRVFRRPSGQALNLPNPPPHVGDIVRANSMLINDLNRHSPGQSYGVQW